MISFVDISIRLANLPVDASLLSSLLPVALVAFSSAAFDFAAAGITAERDEGFALLHLGLTNAKRNFPILDFVSWLIFFSVFSGIAVTQKSIATTSTPKIMLSRVEQVNNGPKKASCCKHANVGKGAGN